MDKSCVQSVLLWRGCSVGTLLHLGRPWVRHKGYTARSQNPRPQQFEHSAPLALAAVTLQRTHTACIPNMFMLQADIRSLSTVSASGTGPCTYQLGGRLHCWPDADIWGSPWHHRLCCLGSSLLLAAPGSFSIVPFSSLLKGCQPDLSLLCCQLLLLALKGNLHGAVLARQAVAAALPGLPLP